MTPWQTQGTAGGRPARAATPIDPAAATAAAAAPPRISATTTKPIMDVATTAATALSRPTPTVRGAPFPAPPRRGGRPHT